MYICIEREILICSYSGFLCFVCQAAKGEHGPDAAHPARGPADPARNALATQDIT